MNPPPEARSWALDSGLALALPPSRSPALSPSLTIVEPSPGSVLFISPELPAQETVLRAVAPPDAASVSFTVDGMPAGTVDNPDARLVWQLNPGIHHVVASARLTGGATVTATSTYEVRTR